MFTVILTFLKSHWQTALIASGIVSVLATLSFQHLEIHFLHGRLDRCHAETITLENSNKALIASIEEQNEAIAALQANAARRKSRGAKALSAAQVHAGKLAGQARLIKAEPPAADECAELKKLVNSYISAP